MPAPASWPPFVRTQSVRPRSNVHDQKGQQRRLIFHVAQFRALFGSWGGKGWAPVGWRQELSRPTAVPFMKAMTMTAWICPRRLGPTKRPLYPRVVAYATSWPRFVASLDGLLSKGN
jgi:hypothetical protein